MSISGHVGQSSSIAARLDDLEKQTNQLPPEQRAALGEVLASIRSLVADLEKTDQQPAPTAPEEDYQYLLDKIPSLIWRSDPDAQCIYFNQAWLEFTGRTLEEELGTGWTDNLHPEDAERVISTYSDAVAACQPFEIEYRLLHHSGDYRWLLDSAQPVHDHQGRFTGFIGTCFDLTEHKQMAAAMKDNETMFRGLFEFAPDAMIAVDQNGIIIHVNHQVERMFGYQAVELINKPVEILMPKQSNAIHHQHVLKYMEAPISRPMGHQLDLYGCRKDGSLFPVDITLGPLNTGQGQVVLAAVRDKTDYKEAERAIRERDKLIQTALSAAPIVFFRVDPKGIIRFSVGHSPVRAQQGIETIGRSIYEVYRSTPGAIENFERALAGESFTTDIVVGGATFILSYAPLYNDNGEIDGVVGAGTDITGYRQVANALANSEARFRTIFDQTNLGMVLIDLQGRVIESNPAFQQMLGYEPQELHQMRYTHLVHHDDLRRKRSLLRKQFSGQQNHLSDEQRYLRKDGESVWVRLSMSLVHGETGEPLYTIGMVENITLQKQMSAELAEVQRRMIDSAETERLHLSQELHDGPLQDLQSINFLLASLEDQDGKAEAQEQVEEAQYSLAAVMRSLRSICGELRPPALAPFGLEKAIRSYLSQTQEKYPDLEIEADLMPDGQQLPEHIRLALFRILQHALTNTVKHAGASKIKVRFQFDDENITLEVRDNGRGFRVPRRWVELVRQGHFGLVGANERARAVGGEFKIESRPGAGTTVQVTVPRHDRLTIDPHSPATMLISRA